MSLSQSNEVPAPVADDVAGDHHPPGAHAVPKRILLGVYGLLLVFTVITVGVAQLNLGVFNIWVALLVAVIKGALVALFFMHLLWDSPFNALVLVAALFFVALFIGIAMLDAHSYQENYLPPQTIMPGMPPEPTTPVVDNTPKVPTLARKELLDEVAARHGDPDLGEQLFTRLTCVGCHTINPNDPLKSPCLANIGKKYNRRELAENIIDPNMKIAEGFETHHYKLDDEIPTPMGPTTDVVDGFLVSETPDKITVRYPTGQTITFGPSSVTKSKVLKTSPMPEGIVNTLTVREFASLLDFLQSL